MQGRTTPAPGIVRQCDGRHRNSHNATNPGFRAGVVFDMRNVPRLSYDRQSRPGMRRPALKPETPKSPRASIIIIIGLLVLGAILYVISG